MTVQLERMEVSSECLPNLLSPPLLLAAVLVVLMSHGSHSALPCPASFGNEKEGEEEPEEEEEQLENKAWE